MPPRLFTLKAWLDSKYGDAIPASCIEAYFLENPSLLPTSLQKSYIRQFPYAIPIVTAGSVLLEVVQEFKDDAMQKLEKEKSAIEPNVLEASLSLSVAEALLTALTFFPDFDNISRDITEELMKTESKDSFRKYMNQYGFDEDWEEVVDLLSPIGLLTAYLRMCTIEIEVLQPGTQEPKAIRFGEVFKCDDNSYLTWIPITIFKYYNISPSVANALLDRTLSGIVMQEAGIEFTYKYEID